MVLLSMSTARLAAPVVLAPGWAPRPWCLGRAPQAARLAAVCRGCPTSRGGGAYQ